MERVGRGTMFKKVILISVVIPITFVILWLVKDSLLNKGVDQTVILDRARLLGDTVVDLYRKDLNHINLESFKDETKYSLTVIEDFKKHQDYLYSLDDVDFNLTEYYNKYYALEEDYKTDIEIFLEENPGVPLFEVEGDDDVHYDYDEIPETLVEDSPFIWYNNDEAFIKMSEVELENGELFVTFKGENFVIKQEDLPLTYKQMKENPKYLYSYSNYMFNEEAKFLDLQYTSVVDDKETLIIRVFFDKKGIITGFKVR